MTNEQQTSAPEARPEPDAAGRRETWRRGDGPYITDAEFQRLTGGDRVAAIACAIGAASMCWDPTPTGVFQSDIAVQIGEDLARYLSIEPNLSAEEGAWLLTLIQNAIPRSPMGPMNWEGQGRDFAERVLSRVANGGPSDLEKRHMALIDYLKNLRGRTLMIPIDIVLEQLGETP